MLRSGRAAMEHFDKYWFGDDPVLLDEIAQRLVYRTHRRRPRGSDTDPWEPGSYTDRVPLAVRGASRGGNRIRAHVPQSARLGSPSRAPAEAAWHTFSNPAGLRASPRLRPLVPRKRHCVGGSSVLPFSPMISMG